MKLFSKFFINKDIISAAQNGDLDKMIELVEQGANVNYKGDYDISPLITAIKYSSTSSSLDMVKLLLGMNANIEQTDEEGNTPLMYACRYLNFKNNISKELLNLLLNYGANVNHKNKDGSTPLHGAITNKSYYATQMLLKYGADINVKSKFMVTPLMIAAANGSIEIVKLLLEHGSKKTINDMDTRGYTSLKYALEYNDYNIANILLINGADPYIVYDTYINEDDKKKFLADHIWNIIYNNIILMSKGNQENLTDIKLPKDIIKIHLLKRKQLQLCKNLTNHNRLILVSFANMLEIPLNDNITKEQLCELISEQLSFLL